MAQAGHLRPQQGGLLPADELARAREYVATNAAAALGAQPEVLARLREGRVLALKAAASASELGASLGGGADAAQWEALERRVLGVRAAPAG